MRSRSGLPCTIEDVIRLLDIRVVRDTGTELICRCPFCDDRSGHFSARLDCNVFHCCRCGAGGGVLHLYAEYQNITLRAAADELRRIFESGEGAAIQESRPRRTELRKAELPIASAADRDNTYTNLLSILTLAPAHREALQERGMSGEDIEWSGYRTTPAVRLSRLAAQLQERGCILEGVPGFYCDEKTGEWKLDIRGHGIMLPDRNAGGEIEAIQIRLDAAHRGHKFNNLTSKGRYYGTSAACCPHFVGVNGDSPVILTEGVMKGDLAHRFSMRLGRKCGVVGLTGVTMKNQYLRALRELKSIGVTKIYLAYDADFRTNRAVAGSRQFALETGAEEGFEMVPVEWTKDYKGIDDLLLSFIRADRD